ncbi:MULTISPECIES: hypothetical protein [Chryseobacterium]|uniref:Uncharacterized protein n=1 Tax=Chryseobacterium camelliae TaxID=1265445 RepID=A0ABU0TF87_9FLAO|nr:MULTISPECIES: hypothetical protein [Chryseobacterium]MDT3406472.1 hypothetical protein [Pseudacidovorax intermedius]MDQ1095729.1 hypothetical protein [Chryseobacterium camelliae]MDQ1099665.1 hypothetical protein [Chryseobacterium sp. SORGH_AS_1048]MDR6087014.1 hypothetical protein [Chryseobacterium sp. SORGH_AS_0909]MDR6131386.1 hypothetical protein [Chryseobacterium sp. SORGH_AS_1175]
MRKKLFSNKWVYVVSLMLTTFTFFIYLTVLFARILNTPNEGIAWLAFASMAVLSGLQIYFLIMKDRKAILLTNIHLGALLCLFIYESVHNFIDLMRMKIYNNDTNGILFGIVLLVLSLYILNRFKVSEIRYQ